jgi:phosphatidylinositol-3-phosphatase
VRAAFQLRLALVALSCAAACNSPATWGNTDVACRALTVTHAQRPSGWNGSVFVIVMENHSFSDLIGSGDAPTINALAREGALAAGYHDPYVHPSEPNYLWMVAGENFGILDDNDPGPSNTIASTSHIADQIEHAGLAWRAYEEDMGAPCGLASHGNYAAKHDPFVYFDDINGWNGTSFSPGERCSTHVVDFSLLATDLASGDVPDYVFITPNLQHDMHDGSVAQGDAWLATVLPSIQSSPRYTRGGVLFLLWDEGSNETDDPPFISVSPNARAGFVSQVAYDASSFLLTTQNILGLDALPCAPDAASVHSMADLFSARL